MTSLLTLITTLAKAATLIAEFFARRQLIKAGEDKAKAEYQSEQIKKIKKANAVSISRDERKRLLNKWSRD